MGKFARDVCVVGGGGHVGLPLAIMFADAGLDTVVYDINKTTVDMVRNGRMPFNEEGAEPLLKRALARGKLRVESTPGLLSECRFLVLVIGTPVDEHLNPHFRAIHRAIDECADQMRDGQIIILRSTVFPGISKLIQNHLKTLGKDVRVAFCPERVAQGYSLREFRELPQIISAFDADTLTQVRNLFAQFTRDVVEMEPMEAELCKLMTNSWRYIQFATVNQFYMIAQQHGLDFQRILHGCRFNYPRMAGMPGPGFAAGPCLVKDTLQLASFSQNNFVLGHAAMLINEGLPAFLVQDAKRRTPLADKTVGVLGMAFKGESDDSRDSLSYKLRKLLSLEAARVLCTDPYVCDAGLAPLDTVLAESQVLFLGAPHKAYRDLKFAGHQIVIDVWGFYTNNRKA